MDTKDLANLKTIASLESGQRLSTTGDLFSVRNVGYWTSVARTWFRENHHNDFLQIEDTINRLIENYQDHRDLAIDVINGLSNYAETYKDYPEHNQKILLLRDRLQNVIEPLIYPLPEQLTAVPSTAVPSTVVPSIAVPSIAVPLTATSLYNSISRIDIDPSMGVTSPVGFLSAFPEPFELELPPPQRFRFCSQSRSRRCPILGWRSNRLVENRSLLERLTCCEPRSILDD